MSNKNEKIVISAMVRNAFDQRSDVVFTLKPERDGTIPIHVNKNDVIAMDVLEFLSDRVGDEIAFNDQIEILQSAIWWAKSMEIL